VTIYNAISIYPTRRPHIAAAIMAAPLVLIILEKQMFLFY